MLIMWTQRRRLTSRTHLSRNRCNHILYWVIGSATKEHEQVHQDIWKRFDHGLQQFTRHPLKEDTSRPAPPFGPSLRANHVLLNNAADTQSHIGWPNFLKGRISNKWAKLWTKTMGSLTAKACDRALIQSLWGHTYRLWIFRNNEDHKNDTQSVAQHKQQALDL
jgi:hypothetical protein